MAVQIPAGVQRFDVQPTPTVGRIQANPPDLSAAMRPQNEAVANAVETAAKFVVKKEEDAADIKATEVANQYERERLEALQGPNGLVHMKGDVTAAYDKYQADGQERMKQFLDDNENVSALTKRKMQEKLMEVDQRYYMKSTVSQGKQNNDYITDTVNDRVDLLKNDLQTSTGLLDANDPASFVPMKNNIAMIIQERYAMAEKLNVPKESVNLQIAKDLSGGLESSISTLNSSGRPDLAEKVLEQYGNFLDARTRPRAIEETRKKRIDVTAQDLAREAEGKGPGATAFIDKIQDDEIRNKTWEFFDSSKRRHEYQTKRVNDETYNRLALHVATKMRSGNPYHSKTQLEQDPDFAKSIRYVTDADDVKKLYKLIEPDDNAPSDPKAVTKFLETYRSGQLVGMPADRLPGLMAGLNGQDARRFQTLWVEQNKDPDSQRRSRFQWSSDRVKDRMTSAGILKYAQGKMTNSSQKAWGEIESNLLRRFADLPKNMDESAFEKEVDKMVADEVKKYNEATWSRRMGWGRLQYNETPAPDSVRPVPRRGQVPNSPLLQQQPESVKNTSPTVTATAPPKATPPPADIGQLSSTQIREGTKLFKEANGGRAPKNVKELKDFLSSRGK